MVVRPDIQVIFSEADRDENLQRAVRGEIQKAKESIRLITMTFSSRKARDALVEAVGRGVDVKMMCDLQFYEDIIKGKHMREHLDEMYKKRIKTFFWHPDHRGLLHHKFCVIDRALVITGSWNWTDKADRDSYEHIVVLRRPDVATVFFEEFEHLRHELAHTADKGSSSDRVGAAAPKRTPGRVESKPATDKQRAVLESLAAEGKLVLSPEERSRLSHGRLSCAEASRTIEDCMRRRERRGKRGDGSIR